MCWGNETKELGVKRIDEDQISTIGRLSTSQFPLPLQQEFGLTHKNDQFHNLFRVVT